MTILEDVVDNDVAIVDDDDDAITIEDGEYTAVNDEVWSGMVTVDDMAVTASAIPVKPPREWFANPGFREVTPLTVQSDGRVFGHAAAWHQAHIGMAGKIKPPKSRSDYAFFATGALECEDGSTINVGQLTLNGGHAPLTATVAEAVAHYDNTQSAVADVTIGEDDHGIWVSGALRPDVDELKLRRLRASGVSGDWRPINGALELIAISAVNVPGFPIPRARVAGGQPVALVAAGVAPLIEASLRRNDEGGHVDEKLQLINERIDMLERAIVASSTARVSAITAAIEESRAMLETARESLRARARGDDSWSDGLSITASVRECAVISLRARARPNGLIATATSAWKADARKEAAKKGEALPDGSFPIKDKRDWAKAKQALGRAGEGKRAMVVRHLKKRATALGIPSTQYENL
jgi:hypothetical protein